MARRVLPFAFALALLSGLAGCSNYERPRRPAWRSEAENVCLAQRLVHVSAYIQPARQIDGPGTCGLDHPFKVSALLDGAVRFNSAYTLDCPMIAALNTWLSEVVQPAAQARFGQPVGEIDSMGAYSCRTMNNMPGGRISEHAFGNALDIGGFRLADGREISVVRDWWRGDGQTRAFLQDVHAGACGQFTTVLGPGSNIFHYNHIHVDLALHGNTSNGPRRICKPFLGPSRVPEPPRDDLPNPPEIEEEIDVADAKAPAPEAPAFHPGPGEAPSARIPDSYFAAAQMPAARAHAPVPPDPVGGSLGQSAPLVPGSQLSETERNLTSSVPGLY
jgi:Extensin-like protein C-terminus